MTRFDFMFACHAFESGEDSDEVGRREYALRKRDPRLDIVDAVKIVVGEMHAAGQLRGKVIYTPRHPTRVHGSLIDHTSELAN